MCQVCMVDSVSSVVPVNDSSDYLSNDVEYLKQRIATLRAEKSVLERYRLIQNAVGEIIAEGRSLDEDLLQIISAICVNIGWNFGELWRVEDSRNVLVCSSSWYDKSIPLREFDKITHQITFAPGIGLPGRVWNSMQPVWIPDVVQDNNFPRAPIAAREGLHTGFAIPVCVRQQLIGVLACFTTQVKPLDSDLLNLLDSVVSHIGLFIERKQSENVERHQAQTMIAVKERQRLAQGLQARTASTLLTASVTASAIPYLWENDHNTLRKFLQELEGLTHISLQQTNEMLLELGTESETHFTQLLQGMIKQVGASGQLNVTFTTKGELKLSTYLQVVIYLVTQEALQNVIQHAYAPQATVGLFGNAEGGELQITDNGRGFDINQVPHKRLGFHIMQQCAERVGARLEITSKPGNGTRLSLYWRNLA